MQSVKEILDELVSDGEVTMEKMSAISLLLGESADDHAAVRATVSWEEGEVLT